MERIFGNGDFLMKKDNELEEIRKQLFGSKKEKAKKITFIAMNVAFILVLFSTIMLMVGKLTG